MGAPLIMTNRSLFNSLYPYLVLLQSLAPKGDFFFLFFLHVFTTHLGWGLS